MEAKYGKQADEFMKSAEKTLKGSLFGNLLKNKSERAEEAIQDYKQAATNYKLAKMWDNAADAFLKCVQCDQIANGGESADYYTSAADMKQKINTAESIKFLEKAMQIHIGRNRVSNAAKLTKRVAELYEKDKEWTLATRYYEMAADRYSSEKDQSSNENNCLLKVVDMCVNMPEIDFSKNIAILDNVAERYLTNKLTAPSARDLFFKAVLLHLAHDDTVGAENAMRKYMDQDPAFVGTRQQKFLDAIIRAVKQGNVKGFAEECYKFNEIIVLDKWKTLVLAKAKSYIPGGAEVAAGGNAEQEQL